MSARRLLAAAQVALAALDAASDALRQAIAQEPGDEFTDNRDADRMAARDRPEPGPAWHRDT